MRREPELIHPQPEQPMSDTYRPVAEVLAEARAIIDEHTKGSPPELSHLPTHRSRQMRVYEIKTNEAPARDNDACLVAAETVAGALQAFAEASKDVTFQLPVTSVRDIGSLYATASD